MAYVKLEVIMRKEPGKKDLVVWMWSFKKKLRCVSRDFRATLSGWMVRATAELREG